MDKHEIAAIFDEIAILLEIQGENPFKVRAYHNAARALEDLDVDLNAIVESGRLVDIPGIGERIAEKITECVQTGKLGYYEELKKAVPTGLLHLFEIPGLGGKKIKILFDELGVKSMDDLLEACQKGEVAKIPHFGEKTQENILKSIQKLKVSSKRSLWWSAVSAADPILEGLKRLPEVEKVELAGSIRRKLETIGDLDFLAASDSAEPIMEWFTTQPWVDSVLAKGATKSSVRLQSGIQADLRVVPPRQYGFAELYFTGSKEHNIKIRHLANDLGYSLNEYGLEPIDSNVKAIFSPRSKKTPSEKDVYQALGLSFVPPELREDTGEIEAAKAGRLPNLVVEDDIKGVFHCHTTESDGHNTLDEMIREAQKYGWEYFGIADHSRSSVQANGLQEERLFKQIEEIRLMNRSKKYSLHIFAGLECDILTDGQLDFPDDVLKELDYVVVSVHRSFNLEEKKMTARIIKAIESPYATMLGHVSGRLLLKRDPYPVNVHKVIDACIANNTVMELNANPLRLDMDWRFWHKAAEKGLKCCINPDAHRTEDLAYFRAGVNIARKGWLDQNAIINTFPLKKVKSVLSLKRSKE